MNKYSTFLAGAALLACAALASGTVSAASVHDNGAVFRQTTDVVVKQAPAPEAITISNYSADVALTIITSKGAACASPTAVFASSPLDVFVFAVLDGTPLGGAADTKVDA